MRYTLWQILRKRGIEIPVFQRDYAQGRSDKATLRRDFLHQLVFSLKGDKNIDGSLDFVYSFGNSSEEVAPLDGQQRLTTLWLLYWYLAVKVLTKEELQEKLETLSKFTYRTRHSSSDFIASLCRVNNVADLYKAIDISDAICNSTWFVKSWLHDPTVLGMLTTLKGSDTTELSSPNGIQPILGQYRHEDLENFWALLISDNCPIIFEHLNIDSIDVKSPDLLYVKMNARGKSLSAYEKFKAQWIKAIKNIDKDKAFKISCLIDNEWSDLFWNKSPKGIDQRKMAFYTRYYLCCLFDELLDSVNGNEKRGEILKSAPLYLKEGREDYDFSFNGLDEFIVPNGKKANSEHGVSQKSLLTFERIDRLEKILHNLKILGVDFIPKALPSYSLHFSYIPVLIADNKTDNNGCYCVKSMNMTDMVIFYAVNCYLYFSKNPNNKSFFRWIRVCCNIAENTNRDSNASTLFGIISRLRELAQNGCDDIYATLYEKYSEVSKNSELDRTIIEERDKAVKILDEGDHFGLKIKEAESYAFFNGAIRFLFTNANGDTDWSLFDKKFTTAKNLFCETGISEQAKKDDITNRILISHCHNWRDQIENNFHLLSHKKEMWRNTLLNPVYKEPIHQLLSTNEFADEVYLNDSDTWRSLSLKRLVDGTYYKYINRNKLDEYYVRWYYGALPEDGMCLFINRYPEDSYFLASPWVDNLKSHEMLEILSPNIDNIYSRRDFFEIRYKGYIFRFQRWGWTDMFVDGKRIQDSEGFEDLKDQCIVETTKVDPRYISADEIKREFERCIDNFEKWKLRHK